MQPLTDYVESFMASIYEDAVDDPERNCTNCTYYTVTKDANATGDSPTLRECEVPSLEQCPYVRSAVAEAIAIVFPQHQVVRK